MNLLALINHALNFAAPAIWLALLMPLVTRILIRKRPVTHAWPAQVAIHFIVCLAGLVLGLVLFGRDGKMLTYLAVVLQSTTCQWAMLRGWQAAKP
jgi:hypothetical protein